MQCLFWLSLHSLVAQTKMSKYTINMQVRMVRWFKMPVNSSKSIVTRKHFSVFLFLLLTTLFSRHTSEFRFIYEIVYSFFFLLSHAINGFRISFAHSIGIDHIVIGAKLIQKNFVFHGTLNNTNLINKKNVSVRIVANRK